MGKREKIASLIGRDAHKRFVLNLIIYILTRLIFILAAVLSVLRKDYLTTFLCVAALVVFMLPPVIDKKFNIELPGGLEISTAVFTFMCVIGGEVGYLYAKFPLWDKILHMFSGFIIAAIGLALIEIRNKHKEPMQKLSPLLTVVFAFCFSVTVAVCWEVFEFAVDSFFGTTDMQADYFVDSFASKKAGGETNPIPVVVNGIESVVITFSDGREALVLPGYIDIGVADTMYDMIVAAIGSFVFCAIEFVALVKRNSHAKRISESFVPKKRESDAEAAIDDIVSGIESEFSEKAKALTKEKSNK
ncbi:MAG: hypothetical protein IJX55_05580 [Clostridia bacterium]|nr:hypothetical protein [Clostridia bacterium]